MWKLDWSYGKKKNGMYVDGHKWENVVWYCNEFLERWKGYEKCMVTYNNDGNINSTPTGFPLPQGQRFRLVLVTHNKSTFYANDCRRSMWTHKSNKATPQSKGKGPLIMILDFQTVNWGRLKDDIECVESLC